MQAKKEELIFRLEQEQLQQVTTLLNDRLLPASQALDDGLPALLATGFDASVDRALDELNRSAGAKDAIRQAVEDNAGKGVADQSVKPLPGYKYLRIRECHSHIIKYRVEVTPKVPEPLPDTSGPDMDTDSESVDLLVVTTGTRVKETTDTAQLPLDAPTEPLAPSSMSQTESVTVVSATLEPSGSPTCKRRADSVEDDTIHVASRSRGQKRVRPTQPGQQKPSQPSQSTQVGMIP